LRFPAFLRRRPSASLIISCTALFLSLGGVGYAATTIAANSVGAAQIKNGAVTYKKIAANSVGSVRLASGGVTNAKLAKNSVSFKDIQAGAVGTVRANLNQIQARLKTSCAAGTAVGTVDSKGNVTCNSTLPSEYDTTSSNAALSASATPVSSLTLATGPNYLVLANPEITATTGAAAVRESVSCTLTVANNTQTRTAVLGVPATPTGGSAQTVTETIPLQAAGGAGAAGVSCTASVPSGATLPATSATGQINALATAPTAGTTTTTTTTTSTTPATAAAAH
jgi:hypothetical protein